MSLFFQAHQERNKALGEAAYWKKKYEREVLAKQKVQRKAKLLRRSVASSKAREARRKAAGIKLSRKQVKQVLLTELSPFFSEPQIMAFLRKKKSWTKIHGWTSSDMSMALSIHFLSPRTYRHIQRKRILPLPGVSTLKKYIQDFQIHEGYLDNVAHFLSLKIKDWSKEEKIVGICFDEVHLKKTIEYDNATDAVIGPHSSANILMVKGLVKNFRMPVWFKFGYGLTPEVLLDIILKLNGIGLNVVVVTCDMGPSNRGLAKGLKVTKEQPFFYHPERPDQPIFYVYDVPHLLKLCRKHFLESGFKLRSGSTITKQMLLKIHSATKGKDIVAGKQ